MIMGGAYCFHLYYYYIILLFLQARLQKASTNLKLGHIDEALIDFETLSVSCVVRG